MLRSARPWTAVLLLAAAAVAWGQETAPTPRPKCAAVPAKKFPDPPSAAAVKPGRFAACMPPKQCSPTDEKGKQALAVSFCAMNQYEACYVATCDKPTLTCQPEYRAKDSKGMKLSNCISRPSKITCPKEGEEICLCDLEIEAKGNLTCGCSCQPAPTPSPTAR